MSNHWVIYCYAMCDYHMLSSPLNIVAQSSATIKYARHHYLFGRCIFVSSPFDLRTCADSCTIFISGKEEEKGGDDGLESFYSGS
ncbi:hypothetical protein Moror_13042 [Moniliophthora roreri MCA 2997]|uniref:Uncharacterized protein n=1 Tax=Moniliophthora roreri (strain MCA 2997) TaxID=1381753 RepID=V2YQA8_MONRO|nr:hypothetical protein Moror_13042 [Moniliophthora roreri MCA 2997]